MIESGSIVTVGGVRGVCVRRKYFNRVWLYEGRFRGLRANDFTEDEVEAIEPPPEFDEGERVVVDRLFPGVVVGRTDGPEGTRYKVRPERRSRTGIRLLGVMSVPTWMLVNTERGSE